MATKTPPKLSGRAVPDAKGNQTWAWNSGTNVDTAVVRALGEGLTLDGAVTANPSHGSNPYDRASTPRAEKTVSKRRTLDDMRRLSEAIKRSKSTPRD